MIMALARLNTFSKRRGPMSLPVLIFTVRISMILAISMMFGRKWCGRIALMPGGSCFKRSGRRLFSIYPRILKPNWRTDTEKNGKYHKITRVLCPERRLFDFMIFRFYGSTIDLGHFLSYNKDTPLRNPFFRASVSCTLHMNHSDPHLHNLF